jgi:hypothetical protein
MEQGPAGGGLPPHLVAASQQQQQQQQQHPHMMGMGAPQSEHGAPQQQQAAVQQQQQQEPVNFHLRSDPYHPSRRVTIGGSMHAKGGDRRNSLSSMSLGKSLPTPSHLPPLPNFQSPSNFQSSSNLQSPSNLTSDESPIVTEPPDDNLPAAAEPSTAEPPHTGEPSDDDPTNVDPTTATLQTAPALPRITQIQYPAYQGKYYQLVEPRRCGSVNECIANLHSKLLLKAAMQKATPEERVKLQSLQKYLERWIRRKYHRDVPWAPSNLAG